MTRPQSESGLAYRPEVDGLRAISVAAVMLFHAGLGFVPGGYVGVDVFFVISGYLITRTILRDDVTGWRWLGHFYMRRVRRIIPALTVVLAASTVVSLFAIDPMQTRAFGASLAASTAFLANIYFWHTSGGYFGFPVDKMPLLHLWSLAIEEQFYLLFPAFAALLYRNRPRLLIWAISAGMTVSLALSEALAATHPNLNFFLLATRSWELGAGALIAELARIYSSRLGLRQGAATWLAASGLVTMLVPLFAYDGATRFPGLSAVPVVGGSALVILFAERTPVARLLALKPLVGLGLISFSAYLWHQPVLAWARIFAATGLDTWVRLLLLGVSCALAAITWRYVERPFRDRRLITSRAVLAILVPAQVVLFSVGILLWLTDGLPQRLSVEQRALMALSRRYHESQQLPCQLSLERGLDAACRLGAKHARITVAVLGDSHAIAIAPAFAKALAERGDRAILLASAGCVPTLEAAPDSVGAACLAFSRAATRRIVADRGINTVVLSARWTMWLKRTPFDNGEGGAEEAPPPPWQSPGQKARAIAGVHALVRMLLSAGKHVIVVYPTPEAGWDVPQYMATLRTNATSVSITTSRARFVDRNREAYQLLDSLGTHGLSRLYPADGLCAGARCKITHGGRPLYFDGNHLTVEGAYVALPNVRTVFLEP